MQTKDVKSPILTTVEWYDDRFYKIQHGDKVEYYPSTTTKLGVTAKPYLARWRGDIGNREADMRVFEAQQRGIRIHSGFETLCKGGTVAFDKPGEMIPIDSPDGFVETMKYQEEYFAVYKLYQFLETVKPKIRAAEMNVYSHKNREAGTLDTLLEIKEGFYRVNGSSPLFIKGGIYVGDVKSGNVVSDDAYMQTTDYASCCEEMGMGPIEGTLILHTASKNRSGIYGFGVHLRNNKEMKEDYEDYRHVSKLWERKNKNIKPQLFEFPSYLKLGGLNEAATKATKTR